MGKQLIFCVESNKKAITDYIYIKHTISRFYPSYNRADIRLSVVYMNGKGNYSKSKVTRQINEYAKHYLVTNPDGQNIVIYCFDCDDYDIKPEDKSFLEEAYDYCTRNGYRLVWFCKEVESVYLGRRVPDKDKVREANAFARKKGIESVNKDKLRVDAYRDTCSNICGILDEYLR